LFPVVSFVRKSERAAAGLALGCVLVDGWLVLLLLRAADLTLGAKLGMSEGTKLGTSEGTDDGALLGALEGPFDGALEGDTLGSLDGDCDGKAEGLAQEELDGALLGTALGDSVARLLL
jgi:hypothetical protein